MDIRKDTIKDHQNLIAYNGFEALENFTKDDFDKYCTEKMAGCSGLTNLIKNEVVDDSNWSGQILEIGSGNSSLLYRLEKEGTLKKGYGVEISESRTRFADAFKQFVGGKFVENINTNILTIKPFKEIDLIIGVDTVFQIIAAIEKSADKSLLKWIWQSLKPGGHVILDFRDMEKDYLKFMGIYGEKEARIWQEFPKNDPWQYLLEHVKYIPEGLIELTRIYIKRCNRAISESTVLIKMYSVKNICDMMGEIGFLVKKAVHNWNNESNDLEVPSFLIIAQK